MILLPHLSEREREREGDEVETETGTKNRRALVSFYRRVFCLRSYGNVVNSHIYNLIVHPFMHAYIGAYMEIRLPFPHQTVSR